MEKYLGVKLCPNHIGWAVVEKDDDGARSVAGKGVLLFSPAYFNDNGKDKSVSQERSEARALRRHYSRFRRRKVRVLRLLSSMGLAPAVPEDQLEDWVRHKRFPVDPAFREWFLTDEKEGRNPYRDRHECLTRRLDLENSERDRYTLGRAIYHINQRRGFLSNRLDPSGANEGGEVWSGINELDRAMSEAGCEYLGEYFYRLYGREPIRRRYTERERHYQKEFRAICDMQGLPEDFAAALYREVFYQRKITQSKKLVGRCKFEKAKTRCPVSRPEFEEFRALSFLNGVKVARPGEECMTPLTEEERNAVLPKFYRRSMPWFKFSDIATALAGRKAAVVYSGEEREGLESWRFNYRKDATVAGCPLTASLRDVFGPDWIDGVRRRYALAGRKGGEKTDLEIVNDVWHVLYTFTTDAYIAGWAVRNLGLDAGEAEAFSKIRVAKGYGSLSLKAVCRILPFLRRGCRYDQSMMLANAGAVFGPGVRGDGELVRKGLAVMEDVVMNYEPNPDISGDSKVRRMEEELCNAGIYDFDLGRMYHPTLVDLFPKVSPGKDGAALLGEPRTDSMRNPAVERALFRLRRLVNSLLEDGVIDRHTRVSVVLSRNLNDRNMRKAIELYQKRNEARREECRAAVQAFYDEAGLDREPSEDDVLKYELWEEQKHIDIYSGDTIGLSDFLGMDASYDIEHTFPLSRGGDDSKENKTLCNWRFNRMVKGPKVPAELGNHEDILAVVATLGWQERIDALLKDIDRQKMNSRTAATPDDRDRAVVRRHLDELELRYLRGKLWRFTAPGVPDRLSRRLDVDVAFIARYAKGYLESVFDDVFVEKRETLASFRRMWGLPALRNERNAVSYGESCVDAAVVACVTGREYTQWTRYKEQYDNYLYADGRKPDPVRKPWSTFTEDMAVLSAGVLSSFRHDNGLFKKTCKRVRRNGRVVRGADGAPLRATGDAVRGSLNKASFYGAILRDGEVRYVIRKGLSDLRPQDVPNIVDEGLRRRIGALVSEHGVAGLKEGSGVPWEGGPRPRSVRVFCTKVKNPASLKGQAYPSRFAHKREYHVMNDGNYAMALYAGVGPDGKRRVRMTLLSNLEAVRRRRANPGAPLFPRTDGNGFRLEHVLRLGMLVLFYENDPSEVIGCSTVELSRRLHRITGLSQQDGRGAVTFVHHLEARSATELGIVRGAWSSDMEYRGRFSVGDSLLKVLVEGEDFRVSVTGEIEFLCVKGRP